MNLKANAIVMADCIKAEFDSARKELRPGQELQRDRAFFENAERQKANPGPNRMAFCFGL